MRVLIVEDEAKTADYLNRGLSEQGFTVDLADNGIDGRHLALHGEYDVIVLDVMLPGVDGYGVLRALRERRQTPVIMLTARERVEDRVRGLREGADDYLIKPFSFLELVARLQALTRRGGNHESHSQMRIADLSIDLLSRKVFRGNTRLELTAKGTRCSACWPSAAARSCRRRRSPNWSGTSTSIPIPMSWRWRSSACAPSSTVRSRTSCCIPSGAWATSWRTVRWRSQAEVGMSLSTRLAGMFAGAAVVIFALIGTMLYCILDRQTERLQQGEVDVRFNMVSRMLDHPDLAERWPHLQGKLDNLSQEYELIRF